MWESVMVAASAGIGYGNAAAAFDVGGRPRSARARVAWAVVLCVFAAGYLLRPVFVTALSGVARGVAAVSPRGWAFFAGVAVAACVAMLLRVPERAQPKIAAAVAAGVCVAIAALWWQHKPAESAQQVAAVRTEAVAESGEKAEPVRLAGELPKSINCTCAAGAWCEGPRGGRYCLTDAGIKRYQQSGK